MIKIVTTQLTLVRTLLARPVDASSLGAFRLLFGGLMVWEVIRYFQHDFIGRYYIEPTFYFTYEWFPFVAPLPGNWMYVLFGVMGLFALAIALGFYYKLAAAFFFLTYTYVFLLDKAPYNNHYYLISLISFLLIFADAHHWASLDKSRLSKPDTVAFWQLFLLWAQIVIVSFYGGIAKLNPDWLVGEPMRLWLANRADYPLVGPLFTTEAAVFFFAYGGLLFDLSIGFLLLWLPARGLAFLALLFFHLTNNWLFSIGIFPFLGIAAAILFVEPAWLRRILRRLGRLPLQPGANAPQTTPLNAWIGGFVVLYLALQILIPLRHWPYPGQVSWTEAGHRFAWHMKLRDKAGQLEFYVTDWILPLEESRAAHPPRLLYLLTLTALVLVNAGLVLSCYLVVAYYRNLQNGPGSRTSFGRGMAEPAALPVTQIPAAALSKVVSIILPYLFALLSLASWAITDNSTWLILGLSSIVLATTWGLYLALTLTNRSLRSRILGLTLVPLNLLTGLFLLVKIIKSSSSLTF